MKVDKILFIGGWFILGLALVGLSFFVYDSMYDVKSIQYLQKMNDLNRTILFAVIISCFIILIKYSDKFIAQSLEVKQGK